MHFYHDQAPLKLRGGSVIWYKIALGGGGALIQSKPVGKCFTEMRNLSSDFAVLGCGHAEPCRCSRRAILFSFWVHLIFFKWLQRLGLSTNRSLRILEFKNRA